MMSASGRCLCSAVRYKFDPDALLWAGYCHCESCRRACSAPVTAYFGVRVSAWRWFGEPARFQSSPLAERYFCPGCGSQLAYRTQKLPDEIHGFAASLDDPATYVPKAHFFHAEALPWLHIDDDLKRHPRGGG